MFGVLQQLLYEIKRIFVWWVTIAPWESALRVRLGKSIVVLGAGVHWVIPYVDRVFKKSVRERVCNIPLQTLTTSDGKTLTIKGTLGYEIRNIKKLYAKLDHAEDTLVNKTAQKVAAYVATHTAAECLPAVVQEAVNRDLDYMQYGIGGGSFGVTDYAFVKTYRLLTGGDNGTYGDALSTMENGLPE